MLFGYIVFKLFEIIFGVCYFFGVAKWPAAGQGCQNTKWLSSPKYSLILINQKNLGNPNYYMLIKKC